MRRTMRRTMRRPVRRPVRQTMRRLVRQTVRQTVRRAVRGTVWRTVWRAVRRGTLMHAEVVPHCVFGLPERTVESPRNIVPFQVVVHVVGTLACKLVQRREVRLLGLSGRGSVLQWTLTCLLSECSFTHVVRSGEKVHVTGPVERLLQVVAGWSMQICESVPNGFQGGVRCLLLEGVVCMLTFLRCMRSLMMKFFHISVDVVIEAGGTVPCGLTVFLGASLQLLVVSSGKEVEVFGQGKCMNSGQRDGEELNDK